MVTRIESATISTLRMVQRLPRAAGGDGWEAGVPPVLIKFDISLACERLARRGARLHYCAQVHHAFVVLGDQGILVSWI